MKIPALLIAVVASAIFSPTFADTNKWRGDLVFGYFDNDSKTERQQVARELLDKIHELHAYIPSLSPAQASWLQAELETLKKLSGDAHTAKMVALVSVPEHNIDWLNRQFLNIEKALECVLRDTGSEIREAHCWASASFLITDKKFSTAFDVLLKGGAIELTPKTREQLILVGDDIWSGYEMFGRAILEHLVLPLTERNADLTRQ